MARRIRRAVKGVSPVLATLILIVVAVVAGLVVYAWVSGWIRVQLGKVREQLTIRAVYIMGRNYDTGNLKYRLEIENTGDATAEVTKIRVKDEDGVIREVGVSWRSTPGSLAYLDFETDRVWEVGESLDIWVFTKAGGTYEATGMSVKAWHSYALIIWDVSLGEKKITDESVSITDSGQGPYSGTLSRAPVKPGSVTITIEYTSGGNTITDTFTDDGKGNLLLDGTDKGDIDYATGEFEVTLSQEPDAGAEPTKATADYTYNLYYIDLLNIGKGTLTVTEIWLKKPGETWGKDRTPDEKESIVIEAGKWYWDVDVGIDETGIDVPKGETITVRVYTDHGYWEGTLTVH